MKRGITFSGNWNGPKLLVQRVTVTGSPYVVWYESAIRSEPAFEAEYGELGSSRSLSFDEPSRTDPYTSSVPMWMTRSMSRRRAVSMTMLVPKQLVLMKSSGPAMERSTWVSAAKCTTAS